MEDSIGPKRVKLNVFYINLQLRQYQYYSTGMLSSYDHFNDHQKSVMGPKKKISKEQKKMEKKIKGMPFS